MRSITRLTRSAGGLLLRTAVSERCRLSSSTSASSATVFSRHGVYTGSNRASSESPGDSFSLHHRDEEADSAFHTQRAREHTVNHTGRRVRTVTVPSRSRSAPFLASPALPSARVSASAAHAGVGRRASAMPRAIRENGPVSHHGCRPRPSSSSPVPFVRTTEALTHIAQNETVKNSVRDAPPLRLDAPFTSVEGEEGCLRQLASSDAAVTDRIDTASHTFCVYCCKQCGTVIFCSEDYAESSSGGRHRSGWPSFTQPSQLTSRDVISEHASVLAEPIVIRSVRQRRTVRASAEGESARRSTTHSSKSSRSSRAALSAQLSTYVADTATATRGLAVEGDMVPTSRGASGFAKRETKSWREQCLRDDNHRSDPSLLEGCCRGCGSAVCRVTLSKAAGATYVTTASAVCAKLLVTAVADKAP